MCIRDRIATSVNAGLDIKEVVSSIEHYRPVHQRLEMLGERDGVTVMDLSLIHI